MARTPRTENKRMKKPAKKPALNPAFKPSAGAADQEAARNYITQGVINNTGQMDASLQQLSTKAGAPGTVNMADLPQGNSFANDLATQKVAANNSAKTNMDLLKKVPEYTTGYKQYLRWRYPKTYGPKSGSGTVSFPSYVNPTGPSLTPATPLPNTPKTKSSASKTGTIGKNAKDKNSITKTKTAASKTGTIGSNAKDRK